MNKKTSKSSITITPQTRKPLSGLTNIGNTCYLNTFVQCMSNTRRICKEVDNFNVNRVQAYGAEKGQFVLSFFTDTLQQVMDLHEKAVLTGDDLGYLLKSLLQHPSLKNSKPPSTANDQQDVHELLGIFLQEAGSTVCEQFNIEFVRTKTCRGPVPHEPRVDLQEHALMLELKLGRNLKHLVNYINDLLTNTLPGVLCSVCNRIADCTEVKQLVRLPPILLIHLSRTGYLDRNNYIKVTERVECPMTLSLSNPHVTVDYTLYAVVLHRGHGNSGHYIALCLDTNDGRWRVYDDKDVSVVFDPYSIINPTDIDENTFTAEVLFYNRGQAIEKPALTSSASYMSLTQEEKGMACGGIPNSASMLSALSSNSYEFMMHDAHLTRPGFPSSASQMSFINNNENQAHATPMSPSSHYAESVSRRIPVPGFAASRQPLTSPRFQTLLDETESDKNRHSTKSPSTPAAAAAFFGENSSFTSPPQRDPFTSPSEVGFTTPKPRSKAATPTPKKTPLTPNERKQKQRADSDKKKKEQEQNTLARKFLRLNPLYKSMEKRRDRAAHADRREDPLERAAEQQLNTAGRANRREDPVYRAAEQKQDTAARSYRREDTVYRAAEQKQDTEARANRREDPLERAAEQQLNTAARANRREEPAVRQAEQKQNTLQQKVRRTDSEFRKLERIRNSAEHLRYKKSKPEKTTQIRASNYSKRHDFGNLVVNFYSLIKEGPTYICVCCAGLFFFQYVVVFDKAEMQRQWSRFNDYFSVEVPVDGKLYICLNCRLNVKEKKIPNLCEKNGLKPPVVHDSIACLNEIEETCIAPLKAFIKFKLLSHSDKQTGVRGNVVCVPIDNEQMLQNMPRIEDLNDRIDFRFMRELHYQKSYMKGKIDPYKVYCALQYLQSLPDSVYVKNRIGISVDWLKQYSHYIEEAKKNDPKLMSPRSASAVLALRQREKERAQAALEQSNPTAFEALKKTFAFTNCTLDRIYEEEMRFREVYSISTDNVLYQGTATAEDLGLPSTTTTTTSTPGLPPAPITFIDDVEEEEGNDDDDDDDNADRNQVEDEEDDPLELCTVQQDVGIMSTEGIMHSVSLAPAAYKSPESITSNADAEQLIFLKIYGGHCALPTNATDGQRYKALLRHYLRPVAHRPDYLIYMNMRKTYRAILSGISIFMKKTETTSSMSRTDALDPECIKALLRSNEAFQIFRTVRSSPAYWSARKKEVFAMIRQLGPPTFFITFSPGEVKFPELIRLLLKLNAREGEESYVNESDEFLLNLPVERLYMLISSDPITVTRYLDQRMAHLRNFIFARQGPFRLHRVSDHVWRLDYQDKGSLHLHMVIWCEKAPVFNMKERSEYEATLIEQDRIMDELQELEEEEEDVEECGSLPNSAEQRVQKEETRKHFEKLRKIQEAKRVSYQEQDDNVCEFVNMYVTCRRPQNDLVNCEELFEEGDERRGQFGRDIPVQYLVHTHRANCRVMEKLNADDRKAGVKPYRYCHYGFPKPIMERTTLLTPIRAKELDEQELDTARSHYKMIREKLIAISKQSACRDTPAVVGAAKMTRIETLQELLNSLKLTFAEYLLALRSSISHVTVFLERKWNELFINNYNRHMYLLNGFNMDIQYVTDAYGCGSYLCAYLLKTRPLNNELMRAAFYEASHGGNQNMRQRLMSVASKVTNGTCASMQECNMNVLGARVTDCSRSFVFANTFTSDKRYLLLRNEETLRMQRANAQVYVYSQQQKYEARPAANMHECFAYFCCYYDFVSKTAAEKRRKYGTSSTLLPIEDQDEDEPQAETVESLRRAVLDEAGEDEEAEEEEDEFDPSLLVDNNINSRASENTAAGAENSNARRAPDQQPYTDSARERVECEERREDLVPLHMPPNQFNGSRQLIGYARKRTQPAILRSCHFRLSKNAAEYYREQLYLYWPWNKEADIEKNENHAELFLSKASTIARNRALFECPGTEEFEEVCARLEQEIRTKFKQMCETQMAELNAVQRRRAEAEALRVTSTTYYDRDSQTGEQVITVEREAPERLPHMSQEEANEEATGMLVPANEDLNTRRVNALAERVPMQVREFVTGELTSMNEVSKDIVKLNTQQHCFLMNFISLIVRNKKFRTTVVGGSGTGKSFLIKCLTLIGNRLYNLMPVYNRHLGTSSKQPTADMSRVRIILCACTGKAAYNINGTTCHAAFHLARGGVSKKKCRVNARGQVVASEATPAACPEHLAAFRLVELVIVDEVSLMGSSLFGACERSLRKFKPEMNELTTTKDFGDVSMLLVGDFRQLPPVMDNWIFEVQVPEVERKLLVQENRRRRELDLPTIPLIMPNPLWRDHFTLYELTIIMRQRNDALFAKALNCIGDEGLAGLSDEQEALLNTRIFRKKSDIPRTAVFLFSTNEKRKVHNISAINAMPGELLINRAWDNATGSGCNSVPAITSINFLRTHIDRAMEEIRRGGEAEEGRARAADTSEPDNLPDVLMLKGGCRYMIVSNEDVKQGLVNGAVCTLRKMVTCKRREFVGIGADGKPVYEENTFASRLWVEFYNPMTGRARRELAREAGWQVKDGVPNDGANWVPISPQTRVCREATGEGGVNVYKIERTQFNLCECQAVTIHKAQGDTYTQVALDLLQQLTRPHVYVALSRCTALVGLFLYNALRGRVLGDKVQRMSAATRAELVRKTRADHPPNAELEWMRRHKPFVNNFSFLSSAATGRDEELSAAAVKQSLQQAIDDPSRLHIIFQNITSFSRHYESLCADAGFRRADVIFLSECRTDPASQYHATKFPDAMNTTERRNEFTLVYMSGSKGRSLHLDHATVAAGREERTVHESAHGQMCYVRTSKLSRFSLVAHNCPSSRLLYDSSNSKMCELSLFSFKFDAVDWTHGAKETLYMLHIYRHPSMSKSGFDNELCAFICKHVPGVHMNSAGQLVFSTPCVRLIIIGDFNFDARAAEEPTKRLEKRLAMQSAYDVKKYEWTTLNCTRIDWCIYKNDQDTRGREQGSGYTKSSERGIEFEQIDAHVYACHYGLHMPIWCSYRSRAACDADRAARERERREEKEKEQKRLEREAERKRKLQLQRAVDDDDLSEDAVAAADEQEQLYEVYMQSAKDADDLDVQEQDEGASEENPLCLD